MAKNQSHQIKKPSQVKIWITGFSYFISSTFKSFLANNCYEKASALSFYTMLSIVPLLAVLFGIGRGFGFGNSLESSFLEMFSNQPEVAKKLIEFAHSNLENIKGGLITGIGTVFLIWSVISLLNSIEGILNQIFKVKRTHFFASKIKNFLTFLFVAPLIFVVTSAINIYLFAKISEISKSNRIIETITSILLFLLNLSPFFLIWFLFTFIYILIPDKKKPFYAGVIAGIVAGTVFQIWQWVYIHFQISLSNYGIIYGSFAAIPLFMIWLQISWLIILAGAVIAVELKKKVFVKVQTSNFLSTKSAALLIVYYCIDGFVKARPPYNENQLAEKLGISLQDLRPMIDLLLKSHLLSKVSLDHDVGYQPARAISDITIHRVLDAVEKSDQIPTLLQDSLELQKIEKILSELNLESLSLGSKQVYFKAL